MTLKDFFDRFVRSPFITDDCKRDNDSNQNWTWSNENEHNSNQRNHSRVHTFSFGIDPSDIDDMFGMMDRMMRDFNRGGENFPSFSEFDENQDNLSSTDQQSKKSLRDQILKPSGDELVPDGSYRNDDDSSPVRRNFEQNGIDSMMRSFFGRSYFAPFMKIPASQQDTDLDLDVQRGGLDSVLKKDNHEDDQSALVPFKNQFSSKMESRSMIRRADGSTEQRITKQDSDGNTETTIITESPSGERRTEIRRSDGSTDIFSDDSEGGVSFQDFQTTDPDPHSSFRSMFHNINSFMKYFFSK